jgi:hypothetical protein
MLKGSKLFGLKRGSYSNLWPTSIDKPRVLYETNADYHDLYDEGLKRTNMNDSPFRRMRFYNIQQAVKNASLVEGNACEIGCYRGLSAWLACNFFEKHGRDIEFHICDSFEGLSEWNEHDKPSHLNDDKMSRQSGKFACTEDEVRKNLSDFNFVNFHKGWIPEPFVELQEKRFCYVHLDVDLYEPTRDSLDFVWPRIQNGGVLLLDDYSIIRYPGAKVAIDEYFMNKDNYLFFDLPTGQALCIKFDR